LPPTVDQNTVEANYENGVLHVMTIDKKAESRPQQIKITGDSKHLPAKAA